MAITVSQKVSTDPSNLEELYNQATAEEISEGMRWYENAYQDCKQLRQRIDDYIYAHKLRTVGLSTLDVIRVVALLSPRVRWAVNLQIAETLLLGWVGGHKFESIKIQAFKANKQKAWDYLSSDRFWVNGTPGKVKVASFAHCIAHYTDTKVVCVDGHAIGAWLGCRTPQATAVGRAYQVIQSDYQKLAIDKGILPHQVQATVWLVYRRLHNIR